MSFVSLTAQRASSGRHSATSRRHCSGGWTWKAACQRNWEDHDVNIDILSLQNHFQHYNMCLERHSMSRGSALRPSGPLAGTSTFHSVADSLPDCMSYPRFCAWETMRQPYGIEGETFKETLQ